MQFTAAQRAAIITDGDLVVVAGAGSGKTRVLVERYIRLLERYSPEQIVAVTFTDKAAGEMRERVRDRLDAITAAKRGPERVHWEERRAEIEGARIGTIHSLCGALLRAHPAETGLDPRFEVLDEVGAGMLLADSVDAALAAALAGAPTPAGVALAGEYGLDELRRLLTTLLRAGAASRAAIAAQPVNQDGLLSLWRSALEQRQRAALAEMLADPGWQDAVAEFWALAPLASAEDRLGSQFLALAGLLEELVQADLQNVPLNQLAALDAINLSGGAARYWGGDKTTVAAARAALGGLRGHYRARSELLAARWDANLEQRAATACAGLAELYGAAEAAYAARKDAVNALDFDDLEALSLRLLREYPAVRERWGQRIRALLVDEFQDTSPEQRDLLYALVGMREISERSADTPDLFIVADGKQSIYRFRGADVAVFNTARAEIVRGGGSEVALDTSFRAQARLIELINGLFEQLFRRNRPLQPFEVAFEPLYGSRAPAPHHVTGELHLVPRPRRGDPFLGSSEDARRYEARVLARRIKALVETTDERLVWDGQRQEWRAPSYGDVTLLFQASTVFEHYEEALRAEGVPFLTTAGRGYYGRKEVRDLVHLLRFLEDPTDDYALVGVLRSPLFALDDNTITRLQLGRPPRLWDAVLAEGSAADSTLGHAVSVLATLLELYGRVSVAELLRAALEQTGYIATISGLRDGSRRRANVEKLLHTARGTGAVGLRAFSAYLDESLAQEAREGEAPLEGQNAVRLMTVHRAKGLEFPIVVLPDLGRELPRQHPPILIQRDVGLAVRLGGGLDKTVPSAYLLAQAEAARQERAERERLAYVALTRAQDYLILAGPEAEASGENWLSWLLAAMGQPWETGGPPEGELSLLGQEITIRVLRHPPPEQALARATDETTGWDLLDLAAAGQEPS